MKRLSAMMGENGHRLLLPLAALLAVLPLILGGTSCGHDFPFHVGNWMEAQHQWSQGVLLPRWDFAAAWNAGEPRFLFYPPLTWMLGAALGTILPWSAVPIVFTWIALTLSGLTLYRLARAHTTSNAALIAACVYLANPYMLFVAYERTAFAELLAAAWMPLLLFEALRPRIRIAPLGIAVALLWLTNAPAAVVGCYTLALIVFLRLFFERKAGIRPLWSLALRSSAGTALGLALAAFYILPAAYERRYVQIQMAVLEGMQPWNNFLFAHSGEDSHIAVLRQASFAALAIFAVALLSAAWLLSTSFFASRNGLKRNARPSHQNVMLLTIVTVIVLFLLTPPSAPIWRHAPQLLFLQFPWRFTAVEEAIAAFLFALALSHLGKNKLASVAALALSVILAFTGDHLYHQPFHDDDTVADIRSTLQNHQGIDPTDEYTPTDADNDSLAHGNPAFWTNDNPDAPPSPGLPRVTTISSGDPYLTFYQVKAGPKFLILNLRLFHGWHLLRDGTEISLTRPRTDGLAAIPLLPGHDNSIEIVYRRSSDQSLGIAISIAALLITVPFVRRERGRAYTF
ncbi:hypothetical protein [Terriglobus saanensis]|uniref:Membrane protein 6-pyruvoyl-tetrahydropterin synthase-related domain-containing protein n=1 Tax=Terriglobus saanensis (strain ATCC BAA-1853 / DSM 23119 / SP1PR4) TaxID=401053 RepID=E8V555_TERSS|nr:hypothetical protein [Terriglobus saanensis]ADV83742.1 hypothetical protein AciPR4_2982 [Terriglobus saanensis SP1PR4]